MPGRPQLTQAKALKGRHEGVDSGGRPLPEIPAFGRIVRAEPPDWLDDYAVKVWHDGIETLASIDALKTADLQSLAVYCDQVATYRQASLDIKERGIWTWKTTIEPDGSTSKERVANPAVMMARQAAGVIRSFAGEFGFTPRAEIGMSKPSNPGGEDEDDPFA